MPPPPGSAAPGSAAVLGGGRPGERLLGGERRPDLVGRKTLVSGSACEVGGMSSAATSCTRATAAMMSSSWAAKWSSSSSPQRQPGQPGEVGDLLAGDAGHAGDPFRWDRVWFGPNPMGSHPRTAPTALTQARPGDAGSAGAQPGVCQRGSPVTARRAGRARGARSPWRSRGGLHRAAWPRRASPGPRRSPCRAGAPRSRRPRRPRRPSAGRGCGEVDDGAHDHRVLGATRKPAHERARRS